MYATEPMPYTVTMECDAMEVGKTMGKRIAEERKKLGLTREKFAEQVGLSAYFIGQIERGARGMSYSTLLKVADCLHISLDYLFRGIVQQQSNDELQALINKCTPKERALLLDVLKAAMPHLGPLNQ